LSLAGPWISTANLRHRSSSSWPPNSLLIRLQKPLFRAVLIADWTTPPASESLLTVDGCRPAIHLRSPCHRELLQDLNLRGSFGNANNEQLDHLMVHPKLPSAWRGSPCFDLRASSADVIPKCKVHSQSLNRAGASDLATQYRACMHVCKLSKNLDPLFTLVPAPPSLPIGGDAQIAHLRPSHAAIADRLSPRADA